MTEQSAHAAQAAVVLDLGADTGALVLYTGPEDDTAEIEISPGTDPAAPRSHNQVHPRRTPSGVVYSAVYPDLAAGTYTLWRDRQTPEAAIIVRGGQVTEHRLSAPLAPARGGHQHGAAGHHHDHDHGESRGGTLAGSGHRD